MSPIERRSLLRCIGLAPIALGALACEAEGGGPRPQGDAANPDLDGGTHDDAASDSGLDDAGLEDSGIQDTGHEHPESCTPTAEDVEGPFFRSGAPRRTTLV